MANKKAEVMEVGKNLRMNEYLAGYADRVSPPYSVNDRLEKIEELVNRLGVTLEGTERTLSSSRIAETATLKENEGEGLVPRLGSLISHLEYLNQMAASIENLLNG